MINKDKISVITPVFNGEKYIKRCIESVQNQTYKNIEHIIVDDGSTDNTLKICNFFNDKIKIVSKKNEGVSKARNVALEIATGEYILFLDADDWLEKDMCEELIECIKKNDVDIAVCGYSNYYENTNKISKIFLKEDETKNFLEQITDEESNFGGFPWNKLIRKEILKKKFDENVHYYENLLFFLENCNEKTTYKCVNKCLYNYCINDNSAVHSKKYNLKKVSSLESLKKVIPLLPQSTIIIHKIHFLNSYFNNLYYIKKYYPESIEKVMKYKSLMLKYYSDIMSDKKIPNKSKIKIFCMKNINLIYKIYKRIKEKEKYERKF